MALRESCLRENGDNIDTAVVSLVGRLSFRKQKMGTVVYSRLNCAVCRVGGGEEEFEEAPQML